MVPEHDPSKLKGIQYIWLFSRALYFSRISNVKKVIFTDFFAMNSICSILLKVLYFTNLVCIATMKFLKYKISSYTVFNNVVIIIIFRLS